MIQLSPYGIYLHCVAWGIIKSLTAVLPCAQTHGSQEPVEKVLVLTAEIQSEGQTCRAVNPSTC